MPFDWIFDENDRRFMAEAIRQARKAADRGEVPVGCVVVQGGEIVARAGNRRQQINDPCGHAELLALRQAGEVLGDWRLDSCTLYVTLEPCPMCVSACRQARLELVVWGTQDPQLGACGTVIDLADDPRLGPLLAHRGGLAAAECGELLRAFFTKTRRPS